MKTEKWVQTEVQLYTYTVIAFFSAMLVALED